MYFYYSAFDFLLILSKVSVSLFILLMCYHMSIFFHLILSTSVLVTLNSQNDNSKISVILECDCDASSVSANCAFCLLVCFVIFLLNVRNDILDKRNWDKQAFSVRTYAVWNLLCSLFALAMVSVAMFLSFLETLS